MSKYLTHGEALEAMHKGCKVAHSSFTSDEYLHLKDGVIRREMDYNFEKGFHDRKDWDPEWFIREWPPIPEDGRKYVYTEDQAPLIKTVHGMLRVL